jgi:hypothetical protein
MKAASLAGPALALLACTTEPPAPTPLGVCNAIVDEAPLEPGIHHEPGTPLTWSTNPPVTGDHYVIWARWGRTYVDPPLERGYWLHNTEHGGVAFLFNCPEGCPDDVARLEALAASLPVDPRCVEPIRNRTLVTADPLLPPGVRIAAVAWGVSYTASCFDESTLRAFVDEHYGQAPENICADSQYPPLP